MSPEEISKMLNRIQHESQDKKMDDYHEMQKSAMIRLDLVVKKLNSLEVVSKKQTQYIDVLESKIIKMNKKFDLMRNLKISELKDGDIDELFSDDSSEQFTINDESGDEAEAEESQDPSSTIYEDESSY